MDDTNKSLAFAISVIFLISMVGCSVPLTKAQSTGDIVINPDGSVTGTNSIQQVGNTYTLTANITGNIEVQKSYVVLNGSGYILNGGIDLNDPNNYPIIKNNYPNLSISNVTIENFYITNGAISSNGGGNYTIYDNYISGSSGDACIMLIGNCYYTNITYCTIIGSNITQAIEMVMGADYNKITECNIIGGFAEDFSLNNTLDKNYWGNYLTEHPNAKEIDNSGIWNMPYSTASEQDNHPLMKPVAIPITSSTSQATVPEFPPLAIIPLFLSMLFVAVVFRHRKTHRLNQ
jgi:hypothetical protein